MTNMPAAVPRLVSINRQQLVLRSMDVEKLVDEDHCVRTIWELGGWRTFAAKHRRGCRTLRF